MKELNKQDMLDILQGVAILGSGGGGQISEGEFYIKKLLTKSDTVRLLSLDEVDDDTILCSPYRIGELADCRRHDDMKKCAQETAKDIPVRQALRLVEANAGETIRGFVSGETGVVNTLVPFYVAASVENGYVVDADGTGRSIPELGQNYLWTRDIPSRTVAGASASGKAFLKDVVDVKEAASILGEYCREHRNMWAIDHVLPKKDIAAHLVGGIISKALEMGKVLRMAKEQGLDAATTISNKYAGRIIFVGVVSHVEETEENGIAVGCTTIKGSKEYNGLTYRLDYKNENLVGWLGDEVSVTVPEIITLINEDGDVILNEAQKIGDVVSVVVLPAPAHYLTEEGLQIFGPSYAGLEHKFKSALAS